jgi:hypothetical protein
VEVLRPIDDSAYEGDETALQTLSPYSEYDIIVPEKAAITLQDDEFSTFMKVPDLVFR